jgi:hypothetical protein
MPEPGQAKVHRIVHGSTLLKPTKNPENFKSLHEFHIDLFRNRVQRVINRYIPNLSNTKQQTSYLQNLEIKAMVSSTGHGGGKLTSIGALSFSRKFGSLGP